MRHRKAGVKLNRTSSHRKAMFRNMVTSLFKYDRIKTTDAKAKELRRWADHIITLAKKGDLNARRQALAIVREKDVVHKLFDEASKRFGKVNGGYTRIVKLGHRPGDAAAISLIELITVEDKPKQKKKKAAPKKQAAAPAAAKKAKETLEDDAPGKASAEQSEEKEAKDQAPEAEAQAEEEAPVEEAVKADLAKDKAEAEAPKKSKAKAPTKKAKAKAKAEDKEAKAEPKETKAKAKAPAKKAPAKKKAEDKE